MSDALETGYRRVLMMLPRTYWAAHAEEMLAVLMDDARPGQTSPKPRQVLSIAALALRLRFAVTGTRASGSNAFAEVARRAILAFLIFDFGLLAQWHAYGARIGYAFVPLLLHAGVIAALILGWSWTGRTLCVAYAAYTLSNVHWQYWSLSILGLHGELSIVAPVAALAAATVVFHRGAPRIVGPNRWFLATTVITAAFWFRGRTIDHTWAFDTTHTPALPALIYVAALAMALHQAKSSPLWPSALALAGLPAVAAEMLAYIKGPLRTLADTPRDAFYVELAVGAECLLVAVALASVAIGLYRRRSVAGNGELA